MAAMGEQKRSWVELLALVLAFLGAMISFVGASFIYLSQAQVAETNLWPLPGLALLDWVLSGSLVVIAVFFSLTRASKRWRAATWLFTGALIPLIILGVFSIGPLVLLSFLLFVISTAILALRSRSNWLVSFGMLMLGSMGNLAILLVIITLSEQIL